MACASGPPPNSFVTKLRKNNKCPVPEGHERQRNRSMRACSPASSRASGLRRLLRPKSASDNVKAVERRQKRIVQAKEEAQKDLTFRPHVPKGALQSRHREAEQQKQQQQHHHHQVEDKESSKNSDFAAPESQPQPELEAVSDRLYRECAERCLLYTSPSPRDGLLSRMPSSA